LAQLERQIDAMLFLDEKHLTTFLAGIDRSLSDLEMRVSRLGEEPALRERLAQLKRSANRLRRCPVYLSDSLDHRKLRQVKPAELLRRIGESVLADSADGAASRELLRGILDPYLKPSFRRKIPT
jgi:hypothetical protein